MIEIRNIQPQAYRSGLKDAKIFSFGMSRSKPQSQPNWESMVINEEASANTMHRRRQLQNWKTEFRNTGKNIFRISWNNRAFQGELINTLM